MSVFKSIKKRLNSPFPNNESFKQDIKGLFIAALIVSSILFFFKPFGLGNYPGSQLLVAFLFGLTTIISGMVIHLVTFLIVKNPYDRPNYRLKTWIVEILILLCGITLGNLILTYFLFDSPFTFWHFWNMLLCTVMLGIFPVVFFGLQKQIQLEKSHSKEAKDLSNNISESKDSGSPVEEIEAILAVESMQNYIHIYKMNGAQLQKITERKTLKKALEELEHHNLTKCHRSFLVNLSQVKKVSGNAQGLKLTMCHEDCPQISVSRSFIGEVKEKLG